MSKTKAKKIHHQLTQILLAEITKLKCLNNAQSAETPHIHIQTPYVQSQTPQMYHYQYCMPITQTPCFLVIDAQIVAINQ